MLRSTMMVVSFIATLPLIVHSTESVNSSSAAEKRATDYFSAFEPRVQKLKPRVRYSALSATQNSVSVTPDFKQRYLVTDAQFEQAPKIVTHKLAHSFLKNDDWARFSGSLTHGVDVWWVYRAATRVDIADNHYTVIEPIALVKQVHGQHQVLLHGAIKEVREGDVLLPADVTIAQLPLQLVEHSTVGIIGHASERSYIAPQDWLILHGGSSSGVAVNQLYHLLHSAMTHQIVGQLVIMKSYAQVSLGKVIGWQPHYPLNLSALNLQRVCQAMCSNE